MNFTQQHKIYRAHQKGFTLVELMVSLTLFVFVVLAAVSSLYSVNDASRKVIAMRTVLDNLNFAVEAISRTVRTGTTLTCNGTANGNYASATGHNCPYGSSSPSDRLSVHNTIGIERDVEFRLTTGSNGWGRVEKRLYQAGVWQSWVALTAPEINVQRLAFYVNGADANDLSQPSVVMFIQGIATSGAGQETAPFAVQTFISQRSAE